MSAKESRSIGTAEADSNLAWVRTELRTADSSTAALTRLFFDAAPPTYICDAAGIVLVKNRAFDEIAAAFYDANAHRPDDTPPGLMRIIERLYTARVPLEETHTIAGRTLKARHTPLVDGNGAIVGFSGTWTDATASTENARRA